MNFFNVINLLESVSLTVKDLDRPENKVNNIYDLGIALRNLIASKFPEYNKNQSRNNSGSPIDNDGLDVDSKSGNINFYTDGFNPESVKKIVAAINYFLGDLNVEKGQPIYDKSKMFKSDVVRFPVIIKSESNNHKLEVNLADKFASILFHDLMNYPSNLNLNMAELSARDLLFKLGQINDFQLNKAVIEPSVDKNHYEFGISLDRIKRKLKEIETLCAWAIENHYDYIQFS